MKHFKLFFALFAMLALNVGNAWGAVSGTWKKMTFSEIPNGSTVIIASSTDKALPSTTTSSSPAQIAITVSGNEDNLTISPASGTLDNLAWTIDNSTATAVKFLQYGSSNVYLRLSGTSSNTALRVANTNSNNTFVMGSAGKLLKLTLANRYVGIYKSGSDWRTYNSETASNYGNTSLIFYVLNTGGSEPATTYAINIASNIENGTVTADVAEAAEGATVTLTATPATGYKFGAWDVRDASSNAVSVDANGKFTMPASNVIVSASFVAKTQYTIKWNVAEGSVDDTKVYEGDALGTLPTADNCSSGKVFVGWTEATSVNADGSSITYAKSTDVPAGNKEYNAVYATLSGSADKIDNLDLSLTGVSGSTYSSWNGKESVSDAVYAGNSAGGNSAIQLRKSSDSQAKSGIITTTSGGKAKKVVVTWNSNTASGRTLNVYGSNSAYSSVDNLYTDATAGTLIGTIVNGTSTELDVTGDYEYIGMRSNSGAMYLDEIEITWSSTSYIDYSLDCETRQEAYLIVAETELEFGTVAQNATVTETLNVSGGYLAEDVTLTISGTDASFFSVNPTTIAKADEIDQDVTITYSPTEIGNHTATLTIKSGDITKTVALSGTVLAPGKWVLVKNVTELSAGDEIIIAAATAEYAIGVAASSNYKGAAITKVGETANATADVTILTVEETGVAEAPYAFKTGSNYLYAASSTGNNLKGKTTLDDHGKWAVTITEGVASIVAVNSSNRNVMQFNPNNGSPIFACYASATQQALAIYRNSENVARPVISGEADFVGSTQVTITAQSGLTVYYTTDGTDPNNTSAQYTAPFTINATTTVKAIAYDASSNASSVAEMTFTKQELVDVATAMALEKNKIAYFDEFEVVKVVAGKGNIYIKDASGHGLIYDLTLAGQLKDGDRVQGFVGISSPYNGLPEAKPHNVTYEDLTITAGTAAEPYDFTSTVIAETDINKYIVFQNVEITENTDMSTNPTLTIGGNSVKFYNQFGVSKTLEAGKIYDIYGFVAVYEKDGNRTLQAYFYEAAQDGEVIQKYTVTYNAGGATGTVPVDNAEYSEGAEVHLKSATSLTYEGYEYKGWKVTDANGTEIPVVSNEFHMPASNVTVTAQWEEIVVTPKEDFSAGIWVRVTNADELATDDYVVVAAANLDVAMKSYESGNYCTHMTITKYGSTFIQWDENVGVFQLAKNDDNYTIQDVNTKQYLYAAGSGTSNYLKAANEIPTDADEVKKYIWTITVEDGITTVKATSENRNTLKYNKNSGQERFSCYASGQEDIALYKYVAAYTRTIASGDYGTICLPYASSSYSGAEFYEISWMELDEDGITPKGIWLDEVNGNLTAGKPYIFKATSTVLTVNCTGSAVANPAAGVAGLVGTFKDIKSDNTILEGNYMISGNQFLLCPAGCWLNANRAYIDASIIVNHTTKKEVIPGRRRVCLGETSENEATGFENIVAPEGQAVKAIVNGQLIIIRDGVKYNVQGQVIK